MMEREKELLRYYSGLYPQVNVGMNANVSLDTDFYSSSNGVESSLNPRQVFWIKKRRLRRETLDSLMKATNSNYIHESRHRHAMKRLRAPSGRFLTKEETLVIKKSKPQPPNK
ncbi:uncharacterized protein VICG_01933 [Vittaforma corneae ATCC 50505]|uniref:Transcriptional activator HAP2 n=1 Tax=Vittaforma corneae (strain ATCC 50505) TaxID=993615 RepID=L2GJL8_VITCO|nr:uncharacterized protein VICG_01933 [Vittaforma corneae ATCC 50505]ELA41051.1 hypothetical protein VICG_01933 [Vittaforma corneae ATCC 50505]